MPTDKELLTVSAARKGEFTKVDESTFHIASSAAKVQSPIAFRTWVQVATGTASLCPSIARNRRVGQFYSVVLDVHDAHGITDRPDPTCTDNVAGAMRAIFPGCRLDKPYQSAVENMVSCFRHDGEQLGRENGGSYVI
jgi:hypothetical protein